jgi:hypothetical protein
LQLFNYCIFQAGKQTIQEQALLEQSKMPVSNQLFQVFFKNKNPVKFSGNTIVKETKKAVHNVGMLRLILNFN